MASPKRTKGVFVGANEDYIVGGVVRRPEGPRLHGATPRRIKGASVGTQKD